MTPRFREVVGFVLRGVTALAAAFAVFYAGSLFMLAIVFAREASKWDEVHVYSSDYAMGESSFVLEDIYAQPPMDVLAWSALAALVTTAFAIVLWGLWLIFRMITGRRERDASDRRWSTPLRVAMHVFTWGVVLLSAYSLAIFLWDWIEWQGILGAGLTFPDDPMPEPKPAYEPAQIPLGVVAFAAIAALPIVARVMLRKRGRL